MAIGINRNIRLIADIGLGGLRFGLLERGVTSGLARHLTGGCGSSLAEALGPLRSDKSYYVALGIDRKRLY